MTDFNCDDFWMIMMIITGLMAIFSCIIFWMKLSGRI